jgi:hypothetical protein
MRKALPLVAVLALAACGGGGAAGKGGAVAALEDKGISATKDRVAPPGILPPGATVYRVTGGELQVFRFDSPAAAKQGMTLVEPDGYTLTDKSGVKNIVDWNAPPHWFRAGREVLVYVGSCSNVIDALRELSGPQFAGPDDRRSCET